MKKNNPTIFKTFLMIADVLAVVVSFALAYYYRVHFDTRPYYFHPETMQFLLLSTTLIPLWVGVNFLSGLYNREVFFYRSREYVRVLVASLVSVMAMISYEFFSGEDIFPVRTIAVYFIGINFLLMIIGRELIRFINHLLVKAGIGRQKALIIGNSPHTIDLAEFFKENVDYGYDVQGVVMKTELLPKRISYRAFQNLKEATKNEMPDVVMQTDLAKSEDVYNFAIENHLGYMFVPQQDRLLSQISNVEIVGGLPMIDLKVTKLFGVGRVWKRLMDLILGWLALIVFAIPMLLIALIMKLTSPRSPVFYKQIRLTRFNREVGIYKFRSMKTAYNGLTPEEGFKKMGKPELAKEYRKNGDQLDNDPRISKLGAFLRRTSLDELPQLFNIIKGDISLVGPRALIPQEINQYKRKSVILAVKSGLTGLAQVSGRRDISFEERRRLDVYYVQNWSLKLDIQILFKTVFSVIFRRGAK